MSNKEKLVAEINGLVPNGETISFDYGFPYPLIDGHRVWGVSHNSIMCEKNDKKFGESENNGKKVADKVQFEKLSESWLETILYELHKYCLHVKSIA